MQSSKTQHTQESDSHQDQYQSQAPMGYSTSNSGARSAPHLETDRSRRDGNHSRTSLYADHGIPIINITSPQVVIETSNSPSPVICVADPQVASGHIIQPEHALQDDPTVDVRDKYKEHLLDQDSASDAALASRAQEHLLDQDSASDAGLANRAQEHLLDQDSASDAGLAKRVKEHLLDKDSASDARLANRVQEHRLQEDVGQQQPRPNPEHTVVECLDGAASPPQASSTLANKPLHAREGSTVTSVTPDTDPLDTTVISDSPTPSGPTKPALQSDDGEEEEGSRRLGK